MGCTRIVPGHDPQPSPQVRITHALGEVEPIALNGRPALSRQQDPDTWPERDPAGQRIADQQSPRQLIVPGTRRHRRSGPGPPPELEEPVEARLRHIPVAAALQPMVRREVDLGADAPLIPAASPERAQILGLNEDQIRRAEEDKVNLSSRSWPVHFIQRLLKSRQRLASRVEAPEVRLKQIIAGRFEAIPTAAWRL